MKKRYIETGEIVGTHGIRGEVRVNPWCDSPEFLTTFKKLFTDAQGENKIKVLSSRVHKNVVLMAIEGIDTVEKAAALRSTVLFIDRKDAKLPKDRYFIQDLIDCKVFDQNSNLLGTLSDVFSTGANDVWSIKKDEKEYLFPAVDEFIKSIDADAGEITIAPPGGIFDNDADEI